MARIALPLCAALALGAGGCSSIGGSAVRTGALRLPPHAGAVQLHLAGQPVEGTDLGIVEVHGAQVEATIETLLPVFAQKVAQIGGNVAVIESTRARFELATHTRIETYLYSCGRNAMCTGTRTYSVNDEVMIVSMLGRALRTGPLPPSPEAP
jgi:hypothetical protein